MSETPTRRAILEAGVFAAVSWLAIDGSVAQAPLPPTTTQLYFPGESQNRSDGLFRSELLAPSRARDGSPGGSTSCSIGRFG